MAYAPAVPSSEEEILVSEMFQEYDPYSVYYILKLRRKIFPELIQH